MFVWLKRENMILFSPSLLLLTILVLSPSVSVYLVPSVQTCLSAFWPVKMQCDLAIRTGDWESGNLGLDSATRFVQLEDCLVISGAQGSDCTEPVAAAGSWVCL